MVTIVYEIRRLLLNYYAPNTIRPDMPTKYGTAKNNILNTKRGKNKKQIETNIKSAN